MSSMLVRGRGRTCPVGRLKTDTSAERRESQGAGSPSDRRTMSGPFPHTTLRILKLILPCPPRPTSSPVSSRPVCYSSCSSAASAWAFLSFSCRLELLSLCESVGLPGSQHVRQLWLGTVVSRHQGLAQLVYGIVGFICYVALVCTVGIRNPVKMGRRRG